VRINRRMMSSLGQSNPPDFAKDEQLSKKLSQLLAQGFTSLDGAIVYTAMRGIAKNVKPEIFPDLTGFECFVNHIHVEDELDGLALDQTAILRQGIAFAFATQSQLRSTFPSKHFKVVVAAAAHGCGVRFHLVRPGEVWLASDLDGYGEEAILVLES
jgi:hypothetical protein